MQILRVHPPIPRLHCSKVRVACGWNACHGNSWYSFASKRCSPRTTTTAAAACWCFARVRRGEHAQFSSSSPSTIPPPRPLMPHNAAVVVCWSRGEFRDSSSPECISVANEPFPTNVSKLRIKLSVPSNGEGFTQPWKCAAELCPRSLNLGSREF